MKKLGLLLFVLFLSACEMVEEGSDIAVEEPVISQTYDVVYHLTHTNTTRRFRYEAGEVLTLLNITREGYTFVGWYLDEALTIPADSLVMPEEEVNVYPKWELVQVELLDEPEVDEPAEEPELVIEEPVIEEPSIEIPEGSTVVIRSQVELDDQIREIWGLETVILDQYYIEPLKTATSIVVIYDNELLKQIPPIMFGVETFNPLEVSVRHLQGKEFMLIHPGTKSYTSTLLSSLTAEDLKTEGDSFYADSSVLNELYPEMIPYGKVGILTELAKPGDSIPFLPAGTHQVFNNVSSFLAADLDTRVVIYPVDRDLGLSPSRYGYQLGPGDVVGFTDNQGVKTVLIRERFSERMEWFFLSYEVLGLEGTYSRDDITRLFQYGGDLYRGTLFTHNRQRFVPRDVAFTGQLSNQSNVVSPIELCQIEQTNRRAGSNVDTNANFGFPLEYVVPPIGEVNVAIIAVEFPDVAGEEEFLPIYLSQVEIMEEWAQFVSGGAMTYNVVFPDRWIMAPREARYYTRLGGTQMALDRPDAIAGQPFEDSVQQLVTASDPYLDWSTIDFVQFVFPIESAKYAVDFQGYARSLYSERSGYFDLFAWGAAYEKFRPDYPDPKHRTLWDWVVHEALHPQGLVGHGPLNGSMFSIMMDQHGETKALLSWESFLMGHFDERQIACINPSEIEEPIHLHMESLDQTGGAPGLKSIMMPVSDSEIIVLEYRTEGPFSTLSPEFRGFTAYYIDVDGQYLRCDWCDPIIMEYQTYTRYIRNPNEILVCDQGFAPTTICNFPSIVQYPGMHLDVFGLRLEFFNDGIVSISRLY